MRSSYPVLTVPIRRDQDILRIRKHGRQITQFLGFSVGDSTRITTALSEIARNAIEYGGGGTVAIALEHQAEGGDELMIRVIDQGPGIADLPAVLSSDFKSPTGMGIGISGSRALMDRFDITSVAGTGTTVAMAKSLPPGVRFGPIEAARLVAELAAAGAATPFGERRAQNQALLDTLKELNARQAEIERLGALADAARERAEVAQAVAERSLVVRERFMALTTHELRTPLNAIMGYIELLQIELASSITEKQNDYLARVQRAAKHLSGLTNDFLDMAQGDAGRLRIRSGAGRAQDVIKEALALVTPQATARGITVTLDDTTESMKYFGDAARVRQVLVNVLGNAVSFTPLGGAVRIVASRVAEPPPGASLNADNGPWCAIRVEDSGPGIPTDKLTHVFEPFVQLSSDGQAARKGSGLGLTVSRQLAVLMAGDLTVDSQGAGAVFTLWLPEEAPRTQNAEAALGMAAGVEAPA